MNGLPPRYRATITDHRITLAPWTPCLARGGTPSYPQAVERGKAGVTLADLTRLDGSPGAPELLVSFVAPSRNESDAKQVLAAWARATGYIRIWFDDEVRNIDPADGLAFAFVECPTCRAEWMDGTADFWLGVYRHGCFPRTCPACGCLLPQWSVRRAPSHSNHRCLDPLSPEQLQTDAEGSELG